MARRKTTTLDVKAVSIAPQNFYQGRDQADIVRIVIHTINGTIAQATNRYNHPEAGLSAHYGVDEDGTIYQWVDEDDTAFATGNWQADISSISIEHADHKDYNGLRPDALYSASAKLIHDICTFYNLRIDEKTVIPHHQINPNTACPDGLDVTRLIKEARHYRKHIAKERQSEQSLLEQKAKTLDQIGKQLGYPQEFIDSPEFAKILSKKLKRVHQVYADSLVVKTGLKRSWLTISNPLRFYVTDHLGDPWLIEAKNKLISRLKRLLNRGKNRFNSFTSNFFDVVKFSLNLPVSFIFAIFWGEDRL